MKEDLCFPNEIKGINTGQAEFEYQGHFQGADVLWQCTLQTLEDHYQSLISTQEISITEPVMLKKFIRIENETSSTPQIHVGLDVDYIDEATIRKTIIMLRNYKNLRAGLHSYGSAYHYPRIK